MHYHMLRKNKKVPGIHICHLGKPIFHDYRIPEIIKIDISRFMVIQNYFKFFFGIMRINSREKGREGRECYIKHRQKSEAIDRFSNSQIHLIHFQWDLDLQPRPEPSLEISP